MTVCPIWELFCISVNVTVEVVCRVPDLVIVALAPMPVPLLAAPVGKEVPELVIVESEEEVGDADSDELPEPPVMVNWPL